MNILQKVKVEQFWNAHTINLNLNKDVNFIIGVNGTGKTTLINIIAATLRADLHTLAQLPFKSIQIDLKPLQGGRGKSTILAEKHDSEENDESEISFQIKDKEKNDSSNFNFPILKIVDEFESSRIRIRSHKTFDIEGLKGRITSLINQRWLSIHRWEGSEEDYFHRSHRQRFLLNTVDSKLEDLSRSFIRKISSLDYKVEQERSIFQKSIFLSLIDSPNLPPSTIPNEFITDLKENLVELFREVNIEITKDLRILINQHLERAKVGSKKMESRDEDISGPEFTALLSIKRIHSIIKEWDEFSKKKEKINEIKNRFLQTINSMLKGKELFVNDQNELFARRTSLNLKENFSLTDLSSGEKQLLIILGEAFLQDGEPCIYIADEPELSLHVDWQEKLVSNLKYVNPNAQII